MAKDLTGQSFGQLQVLQKVENCGVSPSRPKGYGQYKCLCVCGAEVLVRAGNLISGNTQSCGCIPNGAAKQGARYRTPEKNTWGSMRERCYNPKATAYAHYGGRGIQVCEQWLNSFEQFYADMGPRPEGMTLDRIDVDGHYEPTNCRWADAKTQAKNKRKKSNDNS